MDKKERTSHYPQIGEFALEKEGQVTQYIPTSKGIIHYAKDGLMHVVPSDPSELMD